MAAASPILTPEYAPASDWVDGIHKCWAGGFNINLLSEPPIQVNLMVLTSWSPLMHTCFSSRTVALRSPALPLRFSATAGFRVPCRPFDATIAPLYIDQRMPMDIYMTHPQYENVAEAQCLVPFDDWLTLEPYPMYLSGFSFSQFRDANGCKPEGFDPSEPIATRRRMRLAQVPDFRGGSQVLQDSTKLDYDFEW
jgi:hypothetical protein